MRLVPHDFCLRWSSRGREFKEVLVLHTINLGSGRREGDNVGSELGFTFHFFIGLIDASTQVGIP
jgi:hypothetical protein